MLLCFNSLLQINLCKSDCFSYFSGLWVSGSKWKLILIFSTNPCILYIAQCFGQRLQPISRQFANLIHHNTIQWYSRWNTSNRMLSEEKSKRNWSMLMSSQDTTLLLYHDEQMQISSFSLFKHFPIKVNNVTIKI